MIIREFGSWKKALDEAGLELTTKSKKDSTPLTREECVSEMKRVAALLGQNYLTSKMYDKHANINSQRLSRVFGSWLKALDEAELSPSPHYIREIPFENLAKNFLEIVKELGKIPTLQQLVRRTDPVSHTYAGRFGGYSKFKQKAIDFTLSSHPSLPSRIRTILETELEKMEPENPFVPYYANLCTRKEAIERCYAMLRADVNPTIDRKEIEIMQTGTSRYLNMLKQYAKRAHQLSKGAESERELHIFVGHDPNIGGLQQRFQPTIVISELGPLEGIRFRIEEGNLLYKFHSGSKVHSGYLEEI